MSVHRISFNEEANPEYSALWKQYNELVERADQVHLQILQMSVTWSNLITLRPKLGASFAKTRELDGQFLDWKNRATDFALKPKYVVEAGTNAELAYLHFTNILLFLIRNAQIKVLLVIQSQERLSTAYRNQANLMIALVSAGLGFVGLIIALLG